MLIAASDTDDISRDLGNPDTVLQGFRQYLLTVAREVIRPSIRAKVGASDLVQDTFMEAQRHLSAFRGRTEAELRAWLRRILECRIANIERAYIDTEKRSISREVSVVDERSGPTSIVDTLTSPVPSPSNHALRSELTGALDRALMSLPAHYRQTIAWRHHENLSWAEIGARRGCTAEAARKVWSRAIQLLSQSLEGHELVP